MFERNKMIRDDLPMGLIFTLFCKKQIKMSYYIYFFIFIVQVCK